MYNIDSIQTRNAIMVIVVVRGDIPFVLKRLVLNTGCIPIGTNSYNENRRSDKKIAMFALSSPCVRASSPTTKRKTGKYVESKLVNPCLDGGR